MAMLTDYRGITEGSIVTHKALNIKATVLKIERKSLGYEGEYGVTFTVKTLESKRREEWLADGCLEVPTLEDWKKSRRELFGK